MVRPERAEYYMGIAMAVRKRANCLSAARFGIAVAGATCYTTTRPCLGCTKELLQAMVREVRYLHDWHHPETDQRLLYEKLQGHFANGCHAVTMADPEATWALSKNRPAH